VNTFDATNKQATVFASKSTSISTKAIALEHGHNGEMNRTVWAIKCVRNTRFYFCIL